MKLFQVVTNAEQVKTFFDKTGVKLHYLIAYNNLNGQAVKLTKDYRDMIQELYLDSGAYAAQMNKAAISLSEYSLYIRQFGHLFDEIFSLDDDFNSPEHNQINQAYLEEYSGRKPIPVVHDAENPLEELKLYYDLGHRYIAIGSNRKLKDKMFEQIKVDYPDLRLHMFGTFDRKMLMKHRPYSADASSWALQAGMGGIFYWDPVEHKEFVIDVGSRKKKDQSGRIHYSNFPHKDRLEAFLESTFKFTHKDLLKSTINRQIVNFYFFHQLEDYINTLSE